MTPSGLVAELTWICFGKKIMESHLEVQIRVLIQIEMESGELWGWAEGAWEMSHT